jgi:hypothetical protein
MMHRPIAEQGLYLKRVMNGFLNYFRRSHQQPGDQCLLL